MPNKEETNPGLIQQFLDISIKEFREKSWGVSRQYLDVMEISKADNLPIIARIEKEDDSGFAVYFSVEGEKFYYTHYFKVTPIIELNGIDITPANSVYLRVISKDVPLTNILEHTTLSPTRRWYKGELRGPKKDLKAVYKASGFDFEPDENEAGAIEKKLLFLLSQLDNHKAEIEKLRDIGCEVYIIAYWEAYIGNTMLGGFYLNKNLIGKLNSLGLEVDFDIYVSGVSFK